MPIYEFECLKCGKRLEILTSSTLIPRVCGPRCVAEDRAGDGELKRLVSSPTVLTSTGVSTSGKVDPEKAARMGFTTFKKSDEGVYERVAGDLGPRKIKKDDL